MNPYHIEGPAAIAFSGGRTSGYMLAKILEACDGKLPSDVYVTFENTGEEVEPTYQFVREVERRWCPVTWLEYNETFNLNNYRTNDGNISKNRRRRDFSDPTDWGFSVVDFQTAKRKGEPFDMMLRYYWEYRKAIKGIGPILPTRVTRMCTSHLKIKIQDRFMSVKGHTDYEAYAGIRYDEPKRWAKMADINNRSEHYTINYPMVPTKVIKSDVLDFWDHQPFNLQLDPQAEEGNCRLCFLKKTDRVIRILRKLILANGGEPDEEVKRWLWREEVTGMNFRKDRPSIAKLVQIARSTEEIKPTPDEEEIDCFCGSPAV